VGLVYLDLFTCIAQVSSYISGKKNPIRWISSVKNHVSNNYFKYFSRSIDQQINEVIDELLDSYVFSWLRPLVCPFPSASLDDNDSEAEIRRLIRRDIWVALENLSERLSKVDAVTLICNDLVSGKSHKSNDLLI
jgi:hypothetical protein